MGRESNVCESVAALEEEFRRIRESTIHEYDQELQRFREEERILAEQGERYTEDTKRVLSDNGVDAKKLFGSLARTWAGDQQHTERAVSGVRPQLLDEDPRFDEQTREEAARSLFLAGSGWSEAHLIGADVLAMDPESFGGVERQMENPGTWLYETEEKARFVQVKHTASGSGSGCVGRAVPVSATAVWWYSWKPPKAGIYQFWSGVKYHGFYIIMADDGCFSCKRADLAVSASIEVHQHWWRGPNTTSILSLGGQHINKSGLLHGQRTWKSSEYLNTSPIIVKATFSVLAQAKGSGSYAEGNFKDGKGAGVHAPYILVST